MTDVPKRTLRFFVKALEHRFAMFFQAFWIGPVETERSRRMTFRGTAHTFSAVIREAQTGRPLTMQRLELIEGQVQLDLEPWMRRVNSVVVDLFGDPADAERYFAVSASGWTPEELAIIHDPSLLHMIPDVSFEPQDRIRASRERCDPRDPESVARMNAELLEIYRSFAPFSGGVLPDVTRPGLGGVLVAAPGNPPEWIPPD